MSEIPTSGDPPTPQERLREAILMYAAMKAKRAELSAHDALLSKKQDQLEGVILHLLNAAGIDTAAISDEQAERRYTVFRSQKERFSVGDRDAFYEHVFATKARDLLTAAVSSDGVRAARTAAGELPPGVTAVTFEEMSFRSTKQPRKGIEDE